MTKWMITMTDISLPKLINRCREKEEQGYDYITQIKKLSNFKRTYGKTSKGKYDTSNVIGIKFKVAMRKG